MGDGDEGVSVRSNAASSVASELSARTGGASRVSISPSAAEGMIVAALEERATTSRESH